MIAWAVLKMIFGDSEVIVPVVYWTFVALLLIRVYLDCRKLGEGFVRHILLVLMFPLIVGFCWLVIWPGTLRLAFIGKKIGE